MTETMIAITCQQTPRRLDYKDEKIYCRWASNPGVDCKFMKNLFCTNTIFIDVKKNNPRFSGDAEQHWMEYCKSHPFANDMEGKIYCVPDYGECEHRRGNWCYNIKGDNKLTPYSYGTEFDKELEENGFHVATLSEEISEKAKGQAIADIKAEGDLDDGYDW